MDLFYDKEGCIMDHYTCEESFQKNKKRPFIICLKFLYHYEKDVQEHESENENEDEDEQEDESENENENEDEDEQEHESENEDEDDEIINYQQTFKSNECVICLTNSPNILSCNCGHICICIECSKIKNLRICPICKTENTIIRKLE